MTRPLDNQANVRSITHRQAGKVFSPFSSDFPFSDAANISDVTRFLCCLMPGRVAIGSPAPSAHAINIAVEDFARRRGFYRTCGRIVLGKNVCKYLRFSINLRLKIGLPYVSVPLLPEVQKATKNRAILHSLICPTKMVVFGISRKGFNTEDEPGFTFFWVFVPSDIKPILC